VSESTIVVMGVTVNGEREILGIWAGDGAEGARGQSVDSQKSRARRRPNP
jgi:transposase-like protein